MTIVKMRLAAYGYGTRAPGGIRDADGVPVGEVVQAYDESDDPSDDSYPAWLRVKLFSTGREAFVPITGACSIFRSGDNRLIREVDGHMLDLLEQRLAFSREVIERSPPCEGNENEGDGSPLRPIEARLYRHYFPSLGT